MAARSWAVSIATAVGVAAGAGAAQLGLGYGLGVITWLPAAAPAGEATWVASLAWVTWIAATSVIAGALGADRLAGPPHLGHRAAGSGWPAASGAAGHGGPDPGPAGPVATVLWRLALAVAAGIGGLVTVALVAVPARAAERADSYAPELIAAGYAVVGVVGGLAVAFCVLAARAVAANVIATVSWLWLVAVASLVHGALSGRGLAGAQLGVWAFIPDGPWFRNLYLPGMLLSLVAALVIGTAAALPAARRDDNRVGVAVSGAMGPLLVAAAYFLAAPRLAGVRPEQFSAYLLAPYAVIAGLAGSVLASAAGPRRSTAARPPAAPAVPGPAVPGPAVPGPAVPGPAVAAPPVPGPATSRDEPTGHSADAGQTNAGQTNAGQTNAGQTNAGQTNAGQAVARPAGRPAPDPPAPAGTDTSDVESPAARSAG